MPLFEKPHVGHENHLCAKVDAGITLSEYKPLVKDGKFVCRNCGRVAAREENLCAPTPL